MEIIEFLIPVKSTKLSRQISRLTVRIQKKKKSDQSRKVIIDYSKPKVINIMIFEQNRYPHFKRNGIL